MTAREIPAERLGVPRFAWREAREGAGAFDLSSHARAREALEFGLALREPGFNVFVLGQDRSGRMTATLEFLAAAAARAPAGTDWVYLNDFHRPHRPKPYALPAGVGRRFRDRMAALVPRIRDSLARAFAAESYQAVVRAEGERLRAEVAQRMAGLGEAARREGLDVVETEGGFTLVGAAGPPTAAASELLAGETTAANRWLAELRLRLAQWHGDLSRQIAEQAVAAPLDEVVNEFQTYAGLARWLTEMRVDLVERVPRLFAEPAETIAAALALTQRRYAVNLIADRGDDAHAPLVLEPNPTYENLFGRIEYRHEDGALQTDFTLIRPGALHRANGGVLVLRAEALAADAESWAFLKAALRDREIRIEERHRAGGPPLAGAPRPKPVPLEVKIVLVGHPRTHAAAFGLDPDFQTHFRIRADIEPDLPATPENVATYAGMIRRVASAAGGLPPDDAAVARLLAMAARWADSRERLTAAFELIEDLLREAIALARSAGRKAVDAGAVDDAIRQRRRRNARIEDRVHEAIASGQVLIDVRGREVGQINALTVQGDVDHSFGAPCRVTARAAMGRRGVINVERDVALGGPIQQKGAMVIQGWLAGRFARRVPLSFNVSVTFEQSYGGVEGDSASMAELVAILSDLAGLPIRQDVAMTGSVNQRGQAQPVGGVRHKIEGFFRACADAGALTGTQGVAIPAANERNLVLRDEVAEAVAAGRFHVWSVRDVDEAVELLMGVPAGTAGPDGAYPPDSVYGRVVAQLAMFDARLSPAERD